MRYISLLLLFMIAGCGIKQTRSYLTSGDYDSAIATAVEGLRNNKDKKGKQEYVYMLEEAFAKAKERDLATIEMLRKENNPANNEHIYNTFLQLHDRQERIRPLLPLRKLAENRDAKFEFGNYSDEIVSSKNALAKYLYENAARLLLVNDKLIARRAYEDFSYLEQLSPDFKDTRKLIQQAREKGTDYVNVYTKNETGMVIPARLEADLLDFSTYGLNDKWTVYHSNRVKGINYDFGLIINFRSIEISPEQVKEKEFIREREIKDGKRKKVDRNGNPVRDSLGNYVMIDNIKKVKATVNEFRQFKACQVTAKVDYINFNDNQLIQSFPLASEFVFENIFSRYKGDVRAVEEDYRRYFSGKRVAFPSNEQMVYDSGEDLKAKLKDIIVRNRLRR